MVHEKNRRWVEAIEKGNYQQKTGWRGMQCIPYEVFMSDYRRNYVKGGMYFFTVVTEKRIDILNNDKARECLRSAFQHCMKEYPFKIDAMVMLPNHIHAIWTLPDDDFDYSKRWGIIKKQFTQLWLAQGGFEIGVSRSKHRYRRRGVWQRRFWEHTLRNQGDYNRHFDYLHYNPIKHGGGETFIRIPLFQFSPLC